MGKGGEGKRRGEDQGKRGSKGERRRGEKEIGQR